MNPFELRGPEFLLFYAVLGAAVIGVAALLRRTFESGPVPKLGEPDPYLVAYLRGGANEAVRVATICLLDRGLLKAEGELLEADKDAARRVRRPLERKILEEFSVAATASSIFSKTGPREACEALAGELKKYGLLPTSNQSLGRVFLGLGTVAVLWWIAFTKIEIALSRGRYNIVFLVLLALAVPVVVGFALRSRTTILGKRMLQDFQTLFSRLRDRAPEIQAGGATNELVLLAGVFGLGALSGAALAQSHALFPKGTQRKAGATSSSSCGAACGHIASCGSSSGSSCGSSCGGGGCGGGCGGCGS